ncbi:MAG: GtrA family protein [Parvularculaceae bacterium]
MTIAPTAVLKRLAELPLARFATVGLISAVVDFVFFAVLVFGANVAPAPSNAISYALSLVANFNLNRRWTFKQEKDPKVAARQGGRFLVANTGGLLLSTAIVGGLALHLPELWAKIASVPIVFVWNYCLSRFWVFRDAPVVSKQP